MTPDPTPPGIHPTDAMLLLLGDVRSDADAAEFVVELRLEAASGTVADDDPFAPALVADAWKHLGACNLCSSRRVALFVELAPAISSTAADASFAATSALDHQVGAAVAELVPTARAVPESLVRSVPPRRRRFAGRGEIGIGAASGRGGAVTHPWIVGVGVAALLLAVGAAFALRPRTTEQSAVGTVPPRVEQASPIDTTGPETRVFAETEAAASPGAVVATGEMADETAASAPSIAAAPPASTPTPGVDPAAPVVAAPSPPAPEAATGRSASPPAAPSPARASAKTAADSDDDVLAPAKSVQPQPAKKKASAPPTVASAAVAAAPPAGGFEQLTAAADLGTFADAQSALDRFGVRASPVVPADGASTQLGQQPQTANSASPAAAAVAPSTEPVVCPTVKGSPRLAARIVDRPVLIVRMADATADVVLDAATCAEISRRPAPPTTAPAG